MERKQGSIIHHQYLLFPDGSLYKYGTCYIIHPLFPPESLVSVGLAYSTFDAGKWLNVDKLRGEEQKLTMVADVQPQPYFFGGSLVERRWYVQRYLGSQIAPVFLTLDSSRYHIMLSL